VVAEASNGLEAVDKVARFHPSVVLMDIRMPELDGLQATRRILAADSSARILILTTFDLDEYVYEALRAGASGFVLKGRLSRAAHRRDSHGCRRRRAADTNGHKARDPEVRPHAPSCAAERARRAHRPRARRVPPGRSRALERGNRKRALHQRHNRQDARHTHPPEAQSARSRSGSRARLRNRGFEADAERPSERDGHAGR
jgi:chemotaxis response regulator CheB